MTQPRTVWPHLPGRQKAERYTAEARWFGPGRHTGWTLDGTWSDRTLSIARALVEFPFDDRAAIAMALGDPVTQYLARSAA